MLGHFDSEKFANLLTMAIGDRNISSFARDTGVSKNQVSLWLRQKSKPTQKSLKKIALTAQNGVTYDKLLDAYSYPLRKSEDHFGLEALENIITLEDSDDFKKAAHHVISFVRENQVSRDELIQCLMLLRSLKQMNQNGDISPLLRNNKVF